MRGDVARRYSCPIKLTQNDVRNAEMKREEKNWEMCFGIFNKFFLNSFIHKSIEYNCIPIWPYHFPCMSSFFCYLAWLRPEKKATMTNFLNTSSHLNVDELSMQKDDTFIHDVMSWSCKKCLWNVAKLDFEVLPTSNSRFSPSAVHLFIMWH